MMSELNKINEILDDLAPQLINVQDNLRQLGVQFTSNTFIIELYTESFNALKNTLLESNYSYEVKSLTDVDSVARIIDGDVSAIRNRSFRFGALTIKEIHV